MRIHILAAQIAAALTGISAVQAAEAPDAGASNKSIEVIQVTSQKRVQNQQEVPIAITALSEADIERVGATEVKDIQYSTPNLVIGGTNPVQQVFGIRGISDRGRNPGYDQRVGVYVDGVWVGKSAASNQSALDVQTIEVLRGPQGTLFGKNTVAGAINITTLEPTEDFSGHVQAEVGNYNKARIKAAVNGGLTDSLAGKISLSADTRDGYVDNVSGLGNRKLNDKEEFAGRAQLLWQGSATSVKFTVDHLQNDFSDVTAGVWVDDPVAPDPYEVNINAKQDIELKGIGGASVNINHTLDSGFELTSITSYRYEDWGYEDFDEDYTEIALARSGIFADADHVTQEFRVASPVGDRFDYVLGLYYLNQNIEGGGDASLDLNVFTGGAVPISDYPLGYDAVVDTESYAAFGHANIKLAEKWQLTAGLRYTYEEKAIDFSIMDQYRIFFADGSTSEKRDADDWSPKASINWFVAEDVMLYGGYSRAFKSGGFNADFIADLDGLEFDDEQVDAYELGMKSSWLDNSLRFNLALFRSEHSDFQVQAQTPLPTGEGSILTVSNAADLTSQGLELEMQWRITENFTLWGGYGYTDAKFESFDGCSYSESDSTDCSGNRPPEAPEHTFNLAFEYIQPISSGELFVDANYFWRDEMYSNPNNEEGFKNDDFSELGGRFGWRSSEGKFQVFAWGKNLTDETTQIYNSVSFLGRKRAVYNAPLMYGVTFRYNFGFY
ncbi:TonB-dependent receptor [Ferrimonas gelatinilytica]|uniref:TonB-dependent receptor n=1 Tax=Ferrimonas gelatinilytica TaxID=1255257 RepID=A0ABP9S4V3_9GAMM